MKRARATKAEVEVEDVAVILWYASRGPRVRRIYGNMRDAFRHDLNWQRPAWMRVARAAIALGAKPPPARRKE